MEIRTKKQAFLHAFSDFFIFRNKQSHPLRERLYRYASAHPLFAVQIPYNRLVRPDRDMLSAQKQNIAFFHLHAEEKERGERKIRADTAKEPRAFRLTDHGDFELPVPHAPAPIDGEAGNRSPVEDQHEHGGRLLPPAVAVDGERKHLEVHLVFQALERIGENAELFFLVLRRCVRRAGKRARRRHVHGVPAVDAHTVHPLAVPLFDDVERAADTPRDSERTRHVVGSAARNIPEAHFARADPLQHVVERAVSAREQNHVVPLRPVARTRFQIFRADRGGDLYVPEHLFEPAADIVDLLGDLSLSARRIVQKQAIHVCIIL